MDFRPTKAFEAFQRHPFKGLPTTQLEPWRYTSLRSLDSQRFTWAAPQGTWSGATLDWMPLEAVPQKLNVFDPLRDHHTLIDLAAETSTMLAHHHVTQPFTKLHQTVSSSEHFVASILWLTVADGVDAEVEMTLEGTGLRVNIVIVELGKGSRLRWLASNRLQADASLFTATHVTVAQNATWQSLSFDAGAAIARHDLEVRLSGEGAKAHLDGAYLVRKGSHVDHHTVVQHEVGSTVSQQRYKGIVGGRLVFNGRVHVHPGASQCSAKQLNKSVLAHPEAEVNTKPELRIDHDDVECSHGAAVGALDAQQLFYLESRGIKPEDARVLLTQGFMGELLSELKDTTWQTDIKDVYGA